MAHALFLESGLRKTAAAAAGLETTGCEARHLKIETAALALFATDEVVGRNEIVFEVDRVGMHAAITGRGSGRSDEAAASGLLAFERMLAGGFLRNDEE